MTASNLLMMGNSIRELVAKQGRILADAVGWPAAGAVRAAQSDGKACQAPSPVARRQRLAARNQVVEALPGEQAAMGWPARRVISGRWNEGAARLYFDFPR